MGKKEKAVGKVVLDTNILVSALLFHGELAEIVNLWKTGRIVPVLSKETFVEFKTVLEYPKFSLEAAEIKMLIEEEVLPFFEIVEVAGQPLRVCRDPADDKFLACAIAAAADFIVSGDRDLLDMNAYGAVRIIGASELLKAFSPGAKNKKTS